MCCKLHCAIMNDDKFIVKVLLEASAKLDGCGSAGSPTPLELAVTVHSADIIQHLVNAGAVVTWQAHEKATVALASGSLYMNWVLDAWRHWDSHSHRYWWITIAVTLGTQ